MNTIVNKLLDVDREARQMLDEAQQYYERTLQDIETEKQKLQEIYRDKSKKHLEKLEAELADEVEDAVSAARRGAAVLQDAMETRYMQMHEQWQDELFRRCTGQ